MDATVRDTSRVSEPTGSWRTMTAIFTGVIARPRIRFDRRARGKVSFDDGWENRRAPFTGLLGSQAHQAGRVAIHNADAHQHQVFQLQLGHGNLRRSIIGQGRSPRRTDPATG
jgi:hypothetical protein